MQSFAEILLQNPTKCSEIRPSVRISLAKHENAAAMARSKLLAFEHEKWDPAFFPSHAGLTSSELLTRCGPGEVRKIQRNLVGHNIYVTASVRVEDQTGDEKETVVGWASWTGPGELRRRSLWEWLWAEVIYPLQWILFRPPIAPGLPRRIKEMCRLQYSETFGQGSALEGRRHWYLHTLCVEPRWQGLGIGSALMEWGFARAREGDVAIYLSSSFSGIPFYASKGFRMTSVHPCEVNGMVVELPGMIWEPTLGEELYSGSGDVYKFD